MMIICESCKFAIFAPLPGDEQETLSCAAAEWNGVAADVPMLLMLLSTMSPGCERDLVFYRWKHRNAPDIGLFSTALGGDAAGMFLRCLTFGETWPDTAVSESGKKVVLEFERNFNDFVKWASKQLEKQ